MNIVGILLLNMCLLLPLLTSSINGFDSSLVNGQLYLIMDCTLYLYCARCVRSTNCARLERVLSRSSWKGVRLDQLGAECWRIGGEYSVSLPLIATNTFPCSCVSLRSYSIFTTLALYIYSWKRHSASFAKLILISLAISTRRRCPSPQSHPTRLDGEQRSFLGQSSCLPV